MFKKKKLQLLKSLSLVRILNRPYFLTSDIKSCINNCIGNSIRSSTKIFSLKGYHEIKSHDQLKIKEDVIAMHKLDTFLSNILNYCCVVLMPGEFDPTCNYSMPQQPFHPCTLEKSVR